MKRIYVKEITSCRRCPSAVVVDGTGAVCTQPNGVVSMATPLDDLDTIPETCPLPYGEIQMVQAPKEPGVLDISTCGFADVR